MDVSTSIPDEWVQGCRALRETLAGRLDSRTTVAARHLVWSLLQRLRRTQSIDELQAEFGGAGRWLRVMRPFCAEEETVRRIVLAAFAARLMELLRGRDLESLDRLPRPLLSEFVVNEPADL
jgi:hypothetical protein